jgi:twitching motility protein PilT
VSAPAGGGDAGAVSQAPVLLGRLAVHYKLITSDQLAEATRAQEREERRRSLGEVLVSTGLLTRPQLEKLLDVQRELVAQQAAARAAGAPAAVASGTAPSAASGAAPPAPARRVDRLLELAFRRGASDLHLRSGEPVLLRLGGALTALEGQPLAAGDVAALAEELLGERERALLAGEGQVDFSCALPGLARFRGNAYRRQEGLALVLRALPEQVPSLADLGLPASLAKLTNYHQGLVLVTGPAGCGKSSTMAALLRLVNEERRDHIVTIEDPIEYLHRPLRCVVNQRQVGRDTGSFARALKAALREDPDVIAIGELRDLETISLALTAAETGHLVLATLHTGNAMRTVDRVVGVFPPGQQPQVRAMLSESLRAVVSQRLVNRAEGGGRLPAIELLLGTRAVANLIRESKTFQLRSLMQTAATQGMVLLDASLAQLVREGLVTREDALAVAEDPRAIPAGGRP